MRIRPHITPKKHNNTHNQHERTHYKNEQTFAGKPPQQLCYNKHTQKDNTMPENPNTRITKLIDKLAPIWQTRLGLNHWDIQHTYLDTYYDPEEHKVTATTHAQWQYMDANIKWYLPSAVRHNNETIEKILVHELVHVLLSPEQSLVDTEIVHSSSHGQYNETQTNALVERNYEHIELSTEMVTKALLNAWTTT